MDSRHRFPRETIRYCAWLYYTFPLSYRDIDKMMQYRGIEVTYESRRVPEIRTAVREPASAQTPLHCEQMAS